MGKSLLALATLVGTIIGVGLFGLPYVAAKIGFGPILFYFIGLGAMMVLLHLMYGEVASRTPELHRLPGYCKIYLNRPIAKLNLLTSSLGLIGALLAYILVGSEFLTQLLQPIFGGSYLLYAFIFFGFGATIIFFGSGPVSKTEVIGLSIFFVLLVALFFKALPQITYENFLTVDLRHAILPYGVILFSLSGLSVIPEMREVLGSANEKKFRSLVILGSSLPILIYLFFIITVLGVTGQKTTQEGLIGLHAALGNGVVTIGFIFGILTTITSFLTLGITLKKQFQFDLGLAKSMAWVLAVVPPFGLYLLGVQDFIHLIGFLGAALMAIDIILIMAVFLKAKKIGRRIPAYAINIPPVAVFLVMLLFLAGICVEIFSLTQTA